MQTSSPLDNFDLAILDMLQRDNTISQREIAKAVHLSAPAVQRRIRRLRDSGVICAECAVLDATQLGRPLTLLVAVQLHDENAKAAKALSQRILEEPSVQQCYMITGEADLFLVLTAASMSDYQDIADQLFGGDANVRRFQTSVALNCLKTSFHVPLKGITEA